MPHFYEVVGQYYNDNPGPYLLGDKITYADFAVYHLLDNDRRIGVRPVSSISHLQVWPSLSTDEFLGFCA